MRQTFRSSVQFKSVRLGRSAEPDRFEFGERAVERGPDDSADVLRRGVVVGEPVAPGVDGHNEDRGHTVHRGVVIGIEQRTRRTVVLFVQ